MSADCWWCAPCIQDTYGPAFLDLENPQAGFQEVKLEGVVPPGRGRNARAACLARRSLRGSIQYRRLLLVVRGHASTGPRIRLKLERPIVGAQAPLANGKLENYDYDRAGDRFILSFSTATSPTQIYTVEGQRRDRVIVHTRERVLGIAT